MIISGYFNYLGFDWSKREQKAGRPYPSLHDELTVQEMWNGLQIAVTDGMAKFIPKKTSRRKPRKPWVSTMLEQKLKKKKELLRKSKKHRRKKVEKRFQQLKTET